MKKKQTKHKISISVVLTTLIFFLSILTFWFNYQKQSTFETKDMNQYPENIYYKMFPYSSYFASIQKFYQNEKAEIKNETPKVENLTPKIDIYSEKTIPHEEIKKPIEEQIIINSSLTQTPGSISVYGKAQEIDIYYLGKKVDTSSGEFSFNASVSYQIELRGKIINKKIAISSPSYGTNAIISSLTLQINPIAMSATIIGKLNLMLPGEIKGSLFNLSNSSSSSTVLKSGYFATSVTLQEGSNILTATGQWFTIKLDLPSIQVVVTK